MTWKASQDGLPDECRDVLSRVRSIKDQNDIIAWLREFEATRKALANRAGIVPYRTSTVHIECDKVVRRAVFLDHESYQRAAAWLSEQDWPGWGFPSRDVKRSSPRSRVIELAEVELTAFVLRWGEDFTWHEHDYFDGRVHQ